MAHRSNVVQVIASLREIVGPEQIPEKVLDPVCGLKLARQESRFMLFRSESTYYFCSRDCRARFFLKEKQSSKGVA